MALMPIFTKNSCRILFVHIPKTGGTSVKILFEANEWEIEKWAGDGKGGQHSTREEWKNWGDFDLIFTIVRHPVDRLVSDIRGRNIRPKDVDITAQRWIYETYEKHGNHNRPQVDFFRVGDGKLFYFEDPLHRHEILKIAGGRHFPHHKGDTYDPRVTTDLLSQETLDAVQNKYKEDMAEFEYKKLNRTEL